MKISYHAVTILLACALLAGCTASVPQDNTSQHIVPLQDSSSGGASSAPSPSQQSEAASGDPQAAVSLLDAINEEHRSIIKPQVDFEKYTQEASKEPFDLWQYADDDKGMDLSLPLAMEQAQQDVDFLMRALQTTYGAYYYFGGDEAFGKAKEAVLEGCRNAPALTVETLAKLLLEQLSFIKDGHFRIANSQLSRPLISYFYRETAFTKTADGYQALDSGKKLASVEGCENLDKLLRRSISKQGDVVYYPVVLSEFTDSPQDKPADLTLHYADGSSQTIASDDYESYYDDTSEPVQLHENQGIPVLFVRSMGFDEAKDDETGQQFLSYAQQFKEEPVLILDLRSNGGGNGVLPFKWLREYTGQPVTTNHVSIKYWNGQDMRTFAENKDNPYYLSYESMTEIAGFEPISPDYMKANAQPDAFIENEKLLVILTGKNTGSAAETFVDMAHNVSNTVVIGENTLGTLISNAYTVTTLPNSRIPVQLGSDLSFFPDNDDYFEEFAGFSPDFWVSGGDAEELAVQLIQKHLQ